MNKIFILGHEITMLKNRVVIQRWAVLYTHSDSNSKFSQRRIFTDYESALKCFTRGCNYLDSDYDGYNYVALLHDWGVGVGFTPISLRDNLGSAWNVEDKIDG